MIVDVTDAEQPAIVTPLADFRAAFLPLFYILCGVLIVAAVLVALVSHLP